MPQKASVRGRREAFEARLLPPECRKSLWQTRYAEVKLSGKHATAPRMPQNSGKGAARDLKPRYCPQNAAKLWQGRCAGFEARLLPNVAF